MPKFIPDFLFEILSSSFLMSKLNSDSTLASTHLSSLDLSELSWWIFLSFEPRHFPIGVVTKDTNFGFIHRIKQEAYLSLWPKSVPGLSHSTFPGTEISQIHHLTLFTIWNSFCQHHLWFGSWSYNLLSKPGKLKEVLLIIIME